MMEIIDKLMAMFRLKGLHMQKWQQYHPEHGVWFEHKGRDEFRYHNGDYAADVYAELQSGTPLYIIDSTSPTEWLPPHNNETLTQDDRDRILNNLCLVLDHFGRTYRIGS